ncbi:hypothetical protein [Acinetobacter sp. A47]|uniref:hypothetical protein n=1 Tax=Acinetobacter sp. A47 TaxID=1561217 RepID=UPI00056F6D84|nr:hypothetical protein [Acinetobacter sp. A47]
MQIQTRAKITLTFADITAAITEYVTKNGFPITEADLVDTKGLPDELEILVDTNTAPAVQASTPRTRPSRAKKDTPPPKEQEVKSAETPPTEESTQVPDEVVAAYRKKMAEEAAAKQRAEEAANKVVEEALHHSDELDDDEGPQEDEPSPDDGPTSVKGIFDDEPVVKAKPVEVKPNPSSVFADDDDAESEVKPKPAIDTTALFADEVPAQKASATLTSEAETKVTTKGIFDD